MIEVDLSSNYFRLMENGKPLEHTNTLMSVWSSGYNAAIRRWGPTRNPFKEGTAEFLYWNSGHSNAVEILVAMDNRTRRMLMAHKRDSKHQRWIPVLPGVAISMVGSEKDLADFCYRHNCAIRPMETGDDLYDCPVDAADLFLAALNPDS